MKFHNRHHATVQHGGRIWNHQPVQQCRGRRLQQAGYLALLGHSYYIQFFSYCSGSFHEIEARAVHHTTAIAWLEEKQVRGKRPKLHDIHSATETDSIAAFGGHFIRKIRRWPQTIHTSRQPLARLVQRLRSRPCWIEQQLFSIDVEAVVESQLLSQASGIPLGALQLSFHFLVDNSQLPVA